MEKTNKLSDIVLKKGNDSSSGKKIILAVATLGAILIVVVMLMNTLSSNEENNLPKAILPPEPISISKQALNEEPLFEDVNVVQEDSISDESLTEIAQKLKQESINEKEQVIEVSEPEVIIQTRQIKQAKQTTKVAKEVVTKKPKKNVQKKQAEKAEKKAPTGTRKFYIQVGSFSTYAPNKKFLDSITTKGYKYKFYKVKTLNKVLVGPFKTEKEARNALRVIRKDIEAGAFLTKI
jgi:DedD protein